jgi:hypothetical protein
MLDVQATRSHIVATRILDLVGAELLITRSRWIC